MIVINVIFNKLNDFTYLIDGNLFDNLFAVAMLHILVFTTAIKIFVALYAHAQSHRYDK